MHIGIKLFYDHKGTADRDITKGFQTPTWEGIGSEEEDALKRRGFQDEADLCLGATCRLSERKRERDTQKSTNQQQYQRERKEWYVCMKNA